MVMTCMICLKYMSNVSINRDHKNEGTHTRHTNKNKNKIKQNKMNNIDNTEIIYMCVCVYVCIFCLYIFLGNALNLREIKMLWC